MLFNSVQFALFLPIVFLCYWAITRISLKTQNFFLIVTSYIFYAWWDWRFLGLIAFSTGVDYLVGQRIYVHLDDRTKARAWLLLSVVANLGLLGFFKYYNFFVDSFVDGLQALGYSVKSSYTLNIILPIGISFYTFQTLSYSFDIYYGRLKPTTKFVAFAAFVSFFPQLVAGPIERASNLLHQIERPRKFRYTQAADGLKLILWGLFKKLVIADSLAPMVDDIFAHYGTYSSSTLILGAVMFSFQVYGDFSGYSDIAIGTAKLFGIELMSNFRFPHFSRNVAEYWQRWHVSLSTWFRHYLYIPLGGSRVSKQRAVFNIIIVFLVSGLWHGANWTFVFWGGFHALLFIPVFLLKQNRIYMDSVIGQSTYLPSLKELGQVLLTFGLVTFSRIFFRSPTLTDAFAYIQGIFTNFQLEWYIHPVRYRMVDYYILMLLFVLYEYRIRKNERIPFHFKSRLVRFMLYVLAIFGILLFYDDGVNRSFIYFQF